MGCLKYFLRQFLPIVWQPRYECHFQQQPFNTLKAPHNVSTSNLFLFQSIVEEVPARAVRGCSVVHEVSHILAQALNMINEKLKCLALPLSL